MPEHEIRLRAAWEGEFVDVPVRRVDLPTVWSPGLSAPFVLRRAFRPPRYDPAAETLLLRLLDVPGLDEIRLGAALTLEPGEILDREIEIELPATLPDRCVLELRVDPSRWATPPAYSDAAWGRVSLLIRPRG